MERWGHFLGFGSSE